MWILPFPPPACTSKKIPETSVQKMPFHRNRNGIFLLFVCSLIQLHLGSFLHLFFLLIDFKSRPHGCNVPAAELALNTGPPAPGPEPCSPSWPPDHSIDRAVDACDGIQHPDFPLLLKMRAGTFQGSARMSGCLFHTPVCTSAGSHTFVSVRSCPVPSCGYAAYRVS